MLDRLKVAARQKLQRAVAEVVEAELAATRQRLEDMHAESLAKTQALSEQLDAVNDRFGPRLRPAARRSSIRARRDIAYALDVGANADSAAFVRSTCRRRSGSGTRTTRCALRSAR